MAKPNMWILVADASRARVFKLHKIDRRLALKPAWNHESVNASLASRAIASDRPGRSFDSGGEGRHAMEPSTDPARYEKERFAREIVHRLDEARKRNAYEDLIIIAPPQFLGDLRAAIPAPMERCVRAQVNKDLSKLKPVEILDHIEDIIRWPGERR